MSPRLPLYWPAKGVSDNQAHGRQAPLTTPHARNVRTLHKQRVQGTQRPGWSNYTTAPLVPGRSVDALASVAIDLPKQGFRGPGASQLVERWKHRVPGLRAALALETDFEGNLYVLDAAGSFQKIGPDGEVESATSFHIPQLERVVPRISVDSEGNVYVATSDSDGFSSRVIRFERTDDDVFVRSWVFAGIWGIRDFRERFGILAVTRHYAISESRAPADIAVLGGLPLDPPQEFFVSAVPDPVSTIDIDSSGSVLFCSRSNPERNSLVSDEGWVTPISSWSWHELEDVTGLGASTRLHFLVDAQSILETAVNGTGIKRVLDQRWLDTTQEIGGLSTSILPPTGDRSYVPPTDTTPRPLIQDVKLSFWPAGFRTKGAGSMPSLRFGHFGVMPPGGHERHYRKLGYIYKSSNDPNEPNYIDHSSYKREHLLGSCLIAGQDKTNHGAKQDTDDPQNGFPNAEGTMASTGTAIPSNARAVWCTFFVVRYHLRDRAEVMFHHRSINGVEYGLVFNADRDTELFATPSYKGGATVGRLTCFIGQGVNRAAPTRGALDAGGTVPYSPASCDLESANYATKQHIAIICIQHTGAFDAVNGPEKVAGRALFRVNGRSVDRFTMKTGIANAQAEGESFGTTYDRNGVVTLSHLNAWGGDLLEVRTLLGSTAVDTQPNEMPVTWPGWATGGSPPLPRADSDGALGDKQWTWIDEVPGVSDYLNNPTNYTNLASEIERVEGALAYKWGAGNILPNAGANQTTAGLRDATTTFMSAHPFGYFNSTPRPPIGSPAAGGFVLGKTGLALLSSKEILGKVGTSGEVSWAISGGGHGLGVKAGADGSVVAVGQQDRNAGSTVVAKRIKDLGRSVRTEGDDTWELEDPVNIAREPVRGLAVDSASNVYWPRRPEVAKASLEILVVPPGPEEFIINPPLSSGIPSSLYALVSSFSGVPGEVLIGGSKESLAMNLAAAINGTGQSAPPGQQYDPLASGPDGFFQAEARITSAGAFVVLSRKGLFGEAEVWHDTTPGLFAWTNLSASVLQFGGANQKVRMGLSASESRVDALSGKDGEILWTVPYHSDTLDVAPLAVAIDPEIPLYPDKHDLEGVPEFIYIGQRNNVKFDGETADDPAGSHVVKLRQVERVQLIGADKSPRRTIHAATCAGNFYVVAKGQQAKMVSNGALAFNPDSPFAKLFTYRQKIYGFDGNSYIIYDPKKGLLEEWKAEGAGRVPHGAKVGVVWSQRIVLGRTADDPHNLHMSERGNPLGWDTSPSVITPLSAFSGDASGNLHFKMHDLVNCLIPARDDFLIVGGDKSISRLSGDPGGQGQLDNLTTGEGLAFGDAYAIGPDGTVYAKGINGGVWRFSPSGGADRISLDTIERRLQDIDLKEYDVRMVWNFRQEGLHVFTVPKGFGSRLVDHFFWDSKLDAWWPDDFVLPGLQPTSVGIFDGDKPDDRDVVMGCEDGFIRFEDENAKDDGGNRIISECVFGPIVPDGSLAQLALSHLEPVMATDKDGADLELFLGEVSDVVAGGRPYFRRFAKPGFNGYMLVRGRANQAWVQIRSAALSKSWALESLYIRVRGAGRRRMQR